ncbi:hypothetical protein Hanom_Chr07g00646151 [Helianthus anomalus]
MFNKEKTRNLRVLCLTKKKQETYGFYIKTTVVSFQKKQAVEKSIPTLQQTQPAFQHHHPPPVTGATSPRHPHRFSPPVFR